MKTKHTMLLSFGMVSALIFSNNQSTFAQSSQACNLLTPGKISSAVGAKVSSGQAIGSTGCQWSSGPVRATLVVRKAAGWQIMKTPLPHIKRTSAKGIGEDAFYTTVGTLTTLSVKKGGKVFIVRLYGIKGQSKQMAVEKKLAKDVLGKL